MPRLRTSAGRRAPRRQPSPSPPRGRGVGGASIDGVVDMDISDVESSESEEAGGNGDIVDIPIDDVDSDEADRRAALATRADVYSVIDIPIPDVESSSDAGDTKARRGARPRVRRRPVGPPQEKRGVTSLMPPSGDAGGKILQRSAGEIYEALMSASDPPVGCWRGAACKRGCKAIVRKHAEALAIEAAKTYNCTAVQRDMAVFEMAKPIQEKRKVYRLAGIELCLVAVR